MSIIPKILIITARADFGGGPEHVYRLVQKLKNDFEFFIACPDDYPYKKRYSELIGISNIILIPHRKFEIRELYKLKKYVNEKNITLIHSHGKGAGIYSRILSVLTSVPCIHTFHGIHTGKYNKLKKSLYILTETLLSLVTKKFIAVSKGEYTKAVKSGMITPASAVIIENAVNIPEEIISDDNFKQAKKQIVTITRFDFAKNSLLLVDIFKELKLLANPGLYEMVLLGSGEDGEKVKQESISSGMAEIFSFKGNVDNPADYLINSFCYISTSRWEAMPLGIMEAMSFGIPVIASDVTGNNDLVEHNVTGFLFDIDNPLKAAEYIKLISEDFELWKRLSLASRNKIEKNYSLDKMADKTKDLYNEVIKNA